MRARRRRLWTFALTLSASLLILVVVAVAGFRFLVKAVPGYRDDIEQRVSHALDQRLTIGELDLSWRRFRPSLDLLDVTLYGDDELTPAIRLSELNLGIDWPALFIGRLQLAELRIAGLALTVERQQDGSIKVSGISSDKPLTTDDLTRIARAAERAGRVVLADSQLLWLDYTDPNTFHRLGDIELVLRSRGNKHHLQASAELPADFSGSIQIEVEARGELEQFAQATIEADLRLEGMNLGQWLKPWLAQGQTLRGSDAQVQLRSKWQGKTLVSAAGEIDSGALALNRNGEWEPFMESLRSAFQVESIEGGWRMKLDHLNLDAPARQPTMSSGVIEFFPASQARGLKAAANLDQLRLDEIGEWLALFDWHEHAWLGRLQPVGYVQDLRLEYEAPLPATEEMPASTPRYGLLCRFEGLGVSPDGDRPGAKGLGGRLKLDQDSGELLLMVNDGQLLAPRNVEEPVPFEKINGSLQWHKTDEAWLLSSKALEWHGPKGLSGHTDLELKLFLSGREPEINLDMRFAGERWADVRHFFPSVPTIDEDAREWIRTAIVDAHVTEGRAQVRGLLHHFPYHNPHEPGLFRIEFKVSEGRIEYADGWPALERIDADVVFEGRSMQINARSARTIGIATGPVIVGIKDFHIPLLEVDGKVSADTGKMLSFLTESPLREDYSGLVNALNLKGPGKLDLRLEIPLDQLEATRVFGVVTLAGKTELAHAKLPEPITSIEGQVRFDNSGLHARDLRGQLLGLELALQMEPELVDGKHLTRLRAQTDLSLPRDTARLSRLVSADMLSYLHGTTPLYADMSFDASATPARLRLSSDLLGLWVNLPPPFTKGRDEAQVFTVSLDPSTATGMRADIRYGGLLTAALQLRDQQGSWQLDRGQVLFGEGVAQLPNASGLWLDGRLSEIDLALWQKLVKPKRPPDTAKPKPESRPIPGTQESLLQHVDLRLGRLLVSDQQFDGLRVQLARDAGDWLLTATAPSVDGSVRWPRNATGRQTYKADLQRLHLRAPEPPVEGSISDAASDQAEEEPRDPSEMPGLSFVTRSLRVNDHDLGQLQLEVVPIPSGLALSTLNLNGDLNIQGSGNWTRLDGKSSAQLSLSAKGNRMKQMFAALGYTPSLDAEKIRLRASLAWSPQAQGIRTEALGGGFSLDLEKGVLMAVEPGAGRVLGLLNFFALPRRLTLDFRDVIAKGLVFDTLKGDFRIQDGDAWTDNLEVRGPSLQMEIEGRVGIAARDYDQKVTIHPQVSPGVALAGAVAGGPAVGLALLVAQQLFKKPLEDVSELSYRLRGSWDNPTIEKD